MSKVSFVIIDLCEPSCNSPLSLKNRLKKEGGNQTVTKCNQLKLLAPDGKNRLTDVADPSLSLDRARDTWQKHGCSDKWIQQRMMGQETRNKLTDYWSKNEVKEGKEFAILTNIIHQEWTGLSVKDHKNLKGLKSQNLRDHMNEAELIFTALAEMSTRQIAETMEAKLELEQKTGKKVITGDNYLPLKKQINGKKKKDI